MIDVVELAVAMEVGDMEAIARMIEQAETDGRDAERARLIRNLQQSGHADMIEFAAPEKFQVSKEEIRCVDRDGYLDHDPWSCDGAECRYADRRAEQHPEEP